MKKYTYQAKKNPGEFVQGSLVAETQDEAIDKISALGLFPIEVKEEVAAESKKAEISKTTQVKIATRDIIMFYRQVAKMTQSGIPILRAIGFICDQSVKSPIHGVLEDIQNKIGQGESLSQALKAYPKAFSSFDLAMIAAGESIGKLNEALLQLAKHKAEQRALASRVRGALAYPAFISLMGVATVGFMLTHVIPQFSRFFSDLGQDLPIPTQILMAVSGWFQSNWIWILIVFILFAFIVRRVLTSETERKVFDQTVLRIPIVGDLILKVELTRFSRSLEILIKNNTQAVKALKTVIPIVQNHAIRKELLRSCELMEQGSYLSEGLQQSHLFPKFVQYLIKAGEESGRLDEALAEIADWYESEIDETVKIATSLMEPAVILVVGFLLGLIVIAVLMPVFSMNAAIQ